MPWYGYAMPQASIPDTHDEFTRLNANLMGPAGCQSILNAAATRLHQRGAPPMRRCTPVEATIMAKSLLTGIAICTTLAVFAGNAYAYKAHAHKTHKTTTTLTTGTQSSRLPNGARVNTGPHGNDPLYMSCEAPWKYPAYQCPNAGSGP
jgi:hypothetical protein